MISTHTDGPHLNGIRVAKYSPHSSSPLVTARMVECYRDVFAGEPWNEWLACKVCKKHWGTKDMALLAEMKYEHCGKPLVDYWKRERVIGAIHSSIDPQASCWITLNGEDVIGFCWGYPMPLEKLEKELKLSIPLNGDTKIAYQNEVGVVTAFRRRGLAKSMFAHRLDDFLAQGLTYGVVRTRQFPEPSVTFTWYTDLGYTIIARYPDEDGRVILGRAFDSELRKLVTVNGMPQA